MRFSIHVMQDDLNIPEVGTHELYRTLFVLNPMT